MAEVGIGTICRYFPTRDVLIEAVYRQEADTLIDSAVQLMMKREPVVGSCSNIKPNSDL
ncbi:TetR/AcrR family transcriptional regulator [Paenibacillus peoriae]|uniref:TetR/AcrR family transcriptional regulator n=1 Tax=Paenibacillus peoriae TaxID=59893 RepID=UPI00117BEA59|nr:TetR/AcrR family transcriptional regulator [Paenibacillus peoriae]